MLNSLDKIYIRINYINLTLRGYKAMVNYYESLGKLSSSQKKSLKYYLDNKIKLEKELNDLVALIPFA
jgi:hypothetical protein